MADMDDKDAELLEMEKFLDDADTRQLCSGSCGRMLPINGTYFHRDARRESGFVTKCKHCASQDRENHRNQAIMETVERLESESIKILLDPRLQFLEQAPHTATLLEEVMACFGGPQGFARHVMGQYLASKPGSMGRTKILQLVLTLTEKVTAAGKSKQTFDMLSDEDLQRETDRRLTAILKLPGNVDVENRAG
jgi:hypothetical protein